MRLSQLRAGAVAGAFATCSMLQAQDAAFSGRLSFELIEEVALDHKLRLLDDFTFRDESGRVWLAPRGGILQGWSVARVLQALPGLPQESEYRKSSSLHDYYSNARAGGWQDAHRMLHSASLAEGIAPNEARMLFMAVYASGWRWEKKGSSCFRTCHASATTLAWRPDATAAELAPVAAWLEKAEPASLTEIEQRVDAALKRPGPHLFAQVRQ